MKQLLVLILVSGLFGLFLSFPLPSLKQPSTSQLITDKNGVALRVILNQNGDIHLPLKSIPPLVKQAVLAFEDQYFEWHFGINPFSVLRAMWHNLWGKSRIGASTISMQVIRMQTRNQRTLANKLLETLYALQLEWQYEKEEILLQWLNLTPYGSNIIGMETASWLYFGKPLAHLGLEQVLMLSVLPKNPNPSQKQLKTSINRLCKQLKITPYSMKWIDEFFTGKRFKRPPLPYRAAHFAHLPVFDSYPKNESIIRSSLDYNLQLDLNNTLRSLVESHQNLAVTHASGMLLELSSMKILAWAGSQNYFGPLGKNDLNLALRSPGSTLKPLIYTQAFEEGILIPDSQLLDIPQGFSGYFPKNFDRGFKGLISAREALQQSLNIPAIEIELELKTRLHQILKTINSQGLHPDPDHYGPSLVLGGGSLRPLDILRLYSTLAKGGKLYPIEYLEEIKPQSSTSLFSKEAVFMTEEILKNAPLPRNLLKSEYRSNHLPVAFKTGTSAKNRDLLTIAWSSQYMALIWMGRFDSKPTYVSEARNSTAPYVLEFLMRLAHQKTNPTPVPERIIKESFCKEPRFIKLNQCNTIGEFLSIAGISKKQYCPPLRPEQIAWYGNSATTRSCYEDLNQQPPVILKPYGEEIRLNEDSAYLPIQCISFHPDPKVHFMLNGKKLGQYQSGESSGVKVNSGYQEVECIHAGGLSSKRLIKVIY